MANNGEISAEDIEDYKTHMHLANILYKEAKQAFGEGCTSIAIQKAKKARDHYRKANEIVINKRLIAFLDSSNGIVACDDLINKIREKDNSFQR